MKRKRKAVEPRISRVDRSPMSSVVHRAEYLLRICQYIDGRVDRNEAIATLIDRKPCAGRYPVVAIVIGPVDATQGTGEHRTLVKCQGKYIAVIPGCDPGVAGTPRHSIVDGAEDAIPIRT